MEVGLRRTHMRRLIIVTAESRNQQSEQTLRDMWTVNKCSCKTIVRKPYKRMDRQKQKYRPVFEFLSVSAKT